MFSNRISLPLIQLKGLTGQSTTDLVEEKENPIHKRNNKAKRSTCQMNLKPRAIAPKTSTAVAIPSEIGADLQVLDEKVKSMMDKGDKMIPNGKQTKGGTPMWATSYFCKVYGKEGRQKDMTDHIEHNHLEGINISCGLCDKTLSSRRYVRIYKSKSHK